MPAGKQLLIILIIFIPIALVGFLTFFDLTALSVSQQSQPFVFSKEEEIKKTVRWQPKGEVKPTKPAPKHNANIVFLLDFDNQKVIYDKNSTKPVSIASLTKLMTAIVAAQTCEPDKLLEVSPKAANCKGAAVGMFTGDKLNLDELLAGLLMVSGNDTAEVLAEEISGQGREEFVAWMNRKAEILGLENTRFYNPTGLDSGKNYNQSTARELTAIFYHLYDNFPLVYQYFSSQEKALLANSNHRTFYLNHTAWIFTGDYPYLIGGKSGNTDSAGFCLLALAEKENRKLLLVILGEPTLADMRKDTWNLFDWGFASL